MLLTPARSSRLLVRSAGLGVYAPDGQVRVAAPLHISDEVVRQTVVERLDWIREQQAGYAAQPTEPEPQMISGESYHMLFLDGVYVERPDGSLRFRWLKALTSAELTRLAEILAQIIGLFLERQELLERDAEYGYLAREAVEAGLMDQLVGSSIT